MQHRGCVRVVSSHAGRSRGEISAEMVFCAGLSDVIIAFAVFSSPTYSPIVSAYAIVTFSLSVAVACKTY